VTEIIRPVAILRTALRGLVVRMFIGRLLGLGGSGVGDRDCPPGGGRAARRLRGRA
jgi:hypothetical protein